MTPATQSPEATNFAPLQPLLLLGRDNKASDDYLWSCLKERFTYHLGLNLTTWNEMYDSGEQVANFIVGKQFVMPNPMSPGRFLPYNPPNINSQKRAMNITNFYTSNCLWKWCLSNPDIRVNPGVDTDEAEESAVAAGIIVDHYEYEFFNPRIVINEALQGICWGSYIWRLHPDTTKPLGHAIREVFENRTISAGAGYGHCTECDMEGTAEQFQQVESPLGETTGICPDCGASAQLDRPSAEMPVVAEQKQVPVFDLSAKLVPFTNARWDLRFNAEESPWLIIRERTNMGVIKAMFGDVRIPTASSQSTSDSDRGLDIAERLAFVGQPQAGYSRTESRPTLFKTPVTIEEHWLAPEDYADISLKSDTQTVSGETISKGRLIDTFPDGMLVQGLNEMTTIIGIYKEQHRKYITQGSWYSRPMSGAGRGLQDLVEVQKRLNADDSQIHNYLRATSTPAMLVVEGALGEEDRSMYAGMPGENIPVLMNNLPEGMKPQDLIQPAFTPAAVSGQMFEYTYNRLNQFAQIVSHITDFSSGLPGVNNKTATGARITQANSNALFTAPLQLKAQVRKDIMQKTVELYRTHVPIARFFPLKGKYGRLQGKMLAGANICKDLVFDVVPDSEIPKNAEIQRDDYTAFFLAFGGYEGYAMAKGSDPDMVKDIEHAFGIRTRAESYSVVASLCLKRINQMAQFAEMASEPVQLIMAIQPPVDPLEDQIEDKIKWLRSWLDEDSGLEAPVMLRAGVGELIKLLFQFGAQVANVLAGAAGQAQAAAAAPTMQKQAELDAANQPQESTEPDPTALVQMQQERESQQHEASESARDRAHELTVLRAEGERDKQVATHDATEKIRIEKAKPKPKPAPKGKKAA